MTQISPALMFSGIRHGKAEEAIQFYVSLFPNSRVEHIERSVAGEHEREGTVKQAIFVLNERSFKAMDSSVPHNFNFTPSVSLFVDCESEDEIDHLFRALSEAGEALMPLSNYGFSKKFGWVNDRFGVSWQLNLPG